jgi:hypothetical protein
VRNYQNRFMLKKGLIVICLHILLIMNIWKIQKVSKH